ncbi:MAG TPA: thioredoxin fold domain-containing protein [Chitinophagales bacterium]|nr:thioredoxin fold domain-containing protein [Chitinophagales bacterium]
MKYSVKLRMAMVLFALFFSFVHNYAQNTAPKGQGIQFFTGTWEEVKAEAKKQNKPIMVDAYTTWCGPCKMMSANTFPDPKVGEFYNRHYVNYKIDAEKGEGKDFARQYRVDRYPTLLFINGEGEEIYRTLGYQQPAQFIMEGRKGLFDQKTLLAMQQEYNSGKRDVTFMRQFAMLLWAGSLPQYNQIAAELLATLSPEELKQPENLNFVFDFATTLNSKAFDVLLANRQMFAEVVGAKEVSEKIVSVAFQALPDVAAKHDKNMFDQIVNTVKKSGHENADEYTYYVGLDYYNGTADWKNYITTANQYMGKFKTENPNLLNNVAWEFYLHAEKKKDLKNAVKWAKRSVEIQPAFYNHDTYAALLYKTGNKKEALKIAEKAVELAKQARQDYSETQKLIDRIKAGQ